MGFTIGIDVQFDAGHRLLGYGGKCVAPHGHTYRAEIQVESRDLPSDGMVADFSVLKRRVRDWIDIHWDHAFLLNDEDDELVTALGRVADARLFLFPRCNPTAENMARVLYESLLAVVGQGVQSVTIWETATQFASYRQSAEEESSGNLLLHNSQSR